MSSATPHRIDPPITPPGGLPLAGPHIAGASVAIEEATVSGRLPNSAASCRNGGAAGGGPPDSDQGVASIGSSSAAAARIRKPLSQENWLQAHGTELIDRLQAWAADLDAREAELNARSARQDVRERKFRLHQQDAATQLAEQKRAIERLCLQIEAQARRLAFQGDRVTL